jgi:hypothetical protein
MRDGYFLSRQEPRCGDLRAFEAKDHGDADWDWQSAYSVNRQSAKHRHVATTNRYRFLSLSGPARIQSMSI